MDVVNREVPHLPGGGQSEASVADSEGDLSNCFGLNVDLVDLLVVQSQSERLLWFQIQKVPKNHPANHLVSHNQGAKSSGLSDLAKSRCSPQVRVGVALPLGKTPLVLVP